MTHPLKHPDEETTPAVPASEANTETAPVAETTAPPSAPTADIKVKAAASTPVDTATDDPADEPPPLDPTQAVLYSGSPEYYSGLLDQRLTVLGADELASRVWTAGSYENILYNMSRNAAAEASAALTYLRSLKPEARVAMSTRYTDPASGAITISPASAIDDVSSDFEEVEGDAAISAILNMSSGGTVRIPLVASGITIDVLIPDNTELELLLLNCQEQDGRFGSSLGAYYFAYSDQLYVQKFVDYVKKNVVSASFTNWDKNNTLWRMIKETDYPALVMWMAHFNYTAGFDGFIDVCTRPVDKQWPNGCDHKEIMNIRISDMIKTRWPLLSTAQINHMVEAVNLSKTHTEQDVLNYQSQFGFNTRKIVHGEWTIECAVPSIVEHVEMGSAILASIVNEVSADNIGGAYMRLAAQRMSVFGQWIKAVSRTVDKKERRTTTQKAIHKLLQHIDTVDAVQFRGADDDEKSLFAKLNKYARDAQVTYIGYPTEPCPACGYVEDTPSGLKTVEPFRTFFTTILARLTSRFLQENTTENT